MARRAIPGLSESRVRTQSPSIGIRSLRSALREQIESGGVLVTTAALLFAFEWPGASLLPSTRFGSTYVRSDILRHSPELLLRQRQLTKLPGHGHYKFLALSLSRAYPEQISSINSGVIMLHCEEDGKTHTYFGREDLAVP
jgi:hypothetical protein